VVGSRNLDRISMTEWRGKCETVADMMQAGWRHVVARCETCRSDFPVDLAKVARERGPATSLWNRRQARPRPDCPGEVQFAVRIPGLYTYQPMVAADPQTAPRRPTLAEWATRDRQDDGR
jgi:hypothetical protein